MAGLSINQAWNETAAFFRQEARLVLPVSFMLIALPATLLGLAVPETAPNERPPAGAWMALLPLVLAVTLIGQMAISYLAIRPNVSVGEALARGARRAGPMFAALLLVGLGFGVLLIVVSIFAALLIPGALPEPGAGAGAPSAAASLVLLLLLAPMIYVGIRLLLANAVAAAEDVGPVGILKRSWALTRGRSWKLLGLMAAVVVLAVVIGLAVQTVLGSVLILFAGRPEPGSIGFVLLLIVGAVLHTIVAALVAILLARIYAQVQPTSGI